MSSRYAGQIVNYQLKLRLTRTGRPLEDEEVRTILSRGRVCSVPVLEWLCLQAGTSLSAWVHYVMNSIAPDIEVLMVLTSYLESKLREAGYRNVCELDERPVAADLQTVVDLTKEEYAKI